LDPLKKCESLAWCNGSLSASGHKLQARQLCTSHEQIKARAGAAPRRIRPLADQRRYSLLTSLLGKGTKQFFEARVAAQGVIKGKLIRGKLIA
jgi:hypothetical protein